MATDIKHSMVDQNQSQIQQMHVIEGAPISPHHVSNSSSIGNHTTTISTMSPLQAIQTGSNDWGGHSRLQLLQPSISNQTYLQHLYPPVIMSGNIIHPGIGQQPIQVITAGKPFTSGTSQMITTQNKPLISGNTTNFAGSYTLPGIPSTQSQALVFSPVSVIGSQQQQQNILSNLSAQNNNNKSNQQDLQKNLQNQKVVQKLNSSTISNVQNINGQNANMHSNQQCMQVSQTMPTAQLISPLQQQTAQQSMQISSPWVQNVPFWTNGIQPQTLIAPNQIIIRGTQPDGSHGMFIQQASTHQAIQNQQTSHR